MSKSNAERQAEYRARHTDPTRTGGKTAARLNTLISLDASLSLDTLASCYGVTKREIIELVLAAAMKDAEVHALKEAGSVSALYAKTVQLNKVLLQRNASVD